MPPRGWKMRIADILEAVAKIQRYTAGMTFDSFSSDERTLDAVIRNIEVIGEAAASIPPEIRSRYPEVPWGEMRNIRNVVSHVYFGVSERIIWDTVQQDLPPLAVQLRAILDQEV